MLHRRAGGRGRCRSAEIPLERLNDPRALAVLAAAAKKAAWEPRAPRKPQLAAGTIAKGRGIAYARYTHGNYPGYGAAFTAWVADVEVDLASGEVRVTGWWWRRTPA